MARGGGLVTILLYSNASGTPPVPPVSDFRITDNSEIRITDNGDRRIIDNNLSFFVLNFVPNAAFAYSLKQLIFPYTGFAIRVTRSSDNATTDVSFDDNFAVSGNSIVSVGGDLTTWTGADTLTINIWYDQSGNSMDITQSDPDLQPILLLDGGISVNNRAIAQGLGTQGMSGPCSISVPSDFSIFHVIGGISDSVDDNPLFTISNGSSENWLMDHMAHSPGSMYEITERNSENSAFLDSEGIGTSLGDGNFNQFSIVGKNSSILTMNAWQNSTNIYTEQSEEKWQNTAIEDPKFNLLFRTAIDQFFIGQIPEFIMYNRLVSDQERLFAENNQQSYYGI